MRFLRSSVLAAALVGVAMPAAGQTAFGRAVVVGDGEIIVGEPATGNAFRPGRVYVYRKTGGVWREAARLSAAQPERADGFGSTLTQAGNTLFVAEGEGRLAVFNKTNGTWRRGSTVTVPSLDGPAGPVVAAGEWLFVGAPGRAVASGRGGGGGGGGGRGGQPQEPTAGSVLVFKRGADGAWTEQARLTATDGAPGNGFGTSIALGNGIALIGAPGAKERAGAVYPFTLDAANGRWQSAAALAPRGAAANDEFGAGITLNGDVAVIGAPRASANYGAAFVFKRGANGEWTEDSRLAAFAGNQQENFGAMMAASGSDIWVAVPQRSVQSGGARRQPGGAYVFQTKGDAGFAAAQLITPSKLDPDDQFGAPIAVRGAIAAVSSPGADHRAGVVTVFEKNATGQWRETARLASQPDAMEALTGRERRCSPEGKVGVFSCGNAELMSYLPVSKLAIDPRGVRLNDMWGWYDEATKKDYALVGRIEGTSFVDVTDPANPIFVGELLKTPGVPDGTWRDIKVYKNHAYIVADGAGAHGMQVFDLTQLRGLTGKPPKRFQPTAHYTRINSSHNIVINEESGYAYAVGASAGGETCGGGLHMIDIREPKNPKFAGCFADPRTGRRGTGYSHDAQCVTYKGPDARYRGREICLGSNENAMSIADVTDKSNPKAISRAAYPNPAYTHQGWLTEDHKYFYMDDEGDELAGTVDRTRTLVWDLTDLEDPKLALEFMGTSGASDHNLYIKGNLMYQSNYRAGLRVIDITNPTKPVEIGFMDTAPYLADAPGFSGTWSNYPFFKNGAIGVSSVHEGLFLVKVRERPIL